MSVVSFSLWLEAYAEEEGRKRLCVLTMISPVFKGVLAMAHPPRHYHDWADTGGSWGPQVEERLPSRRDPIPFDRDAFIHFDLDLQNSEWLLPGILVDSKRLADV